MFGRFVVERNLLSLMMMEKNERKCERRGGFIGIF
jgi:hypothetical protein